MPISTEAQKLSPQTTRALYPNDISFKFKLLSNVAGFENLFVSLKNFLEE
jgi:hypothetical protein